MKNLICNLNFPPCLPTPMVALEGVQGVCLQPIKFLFGCRHPPQSDYQSIKVPIVLEINLEW